MIIKLLVEGGNMKPGPAISQKIGPLGINMGKVIQDINKSTESFKGLKVPVELDVDPKSKTFKVNVFSPPVSELIKKEIGIELGSGDSKKTKVGNLSIEQVISVAKTKFGNMLAKDLKAAVMSVVGSCVSLGVLIENKEAKDTSKDISAGNYNKEISQEKTKTDEKKLQELKSYFENIKRAQEDALKKEEAAKAAAEAAEAAAAAAAPKPAEAGKEEAKPAAGKEAKPAEAGKEAKPAAGKEAKPAAKPEAKKK
jgi:large subunit ribosomal protein L11